MATTVESLRSPRRLQRRAVWPVLSLALALCATGAMAQGESQCGPVAIPGMYGPYDYVTERGRIVIVEQHHFGPKVEALIAGQEGYLGGDLSYVLNASPNHHRALVAIMRFGARTKSPQPPYLDKTIECFFDRAVRFRPKDTVVRSLYAMYLGQQLQRVPEALRQLDAASEAAGDNPLSHHNIGLTYLDLQQYDQALAQAQLAKKLGYENSQLEVKLKALNKWKEPEP